jgi:hypothetical protein
MKVKILLVVIALAVLGFMFKSQITDNLKKDISGCMDPLASNYNPKATEDSDSCSFEKELSADLFNKIEHLKISDWDVNGYKNLNANIRIYFTSLGQSNSDQENIALNKLDMAYMIVLGNATDKKILNCLKSSSDLKKEVEKLYAEYGTVNKAIKDANDSFNSYSKIYGYRKKVKSLLKKRFVKANFDKLKGWIFTFSKSKSFLQFKHCQGLKNIISNGIDDLDKYEEIDKRYNQFEIDHTPGEMEMPKEFVTERYFKMFKDYEWYYNEVIETDLRLKKAKEENDEKKREKEEGRKME